MIPEKKEAVMARLKNGGYIDKCGVINLWLCHDPAHGWPAPIELAPADMAELREAELVALSPAGSRYYLNQGATA